MPKRRPAGKSPKSERAGTARAVTLGIDLGATKAVAGAVDAYGRVVATSDRVRHANDGPAGVLRAVVESARQCLDRTSARPRVVGLSVAAQVNPTTGTVEYAPNLRWRDEPVGPVLEDALGLPVRIVNDGRAATLAEWRYGAGAGAHDLFCLVLGTGVGGSAVVAGKLVEGATHAAGEVGHLTIVAGGRRCHCPNSGCFEAYVGGWAIADRAREAARSGAGPRPDDVEAITAEGVFAAGRRGEPGAVRLIRETEEYLCAGVVSIANAFNPEVLVIAGGLAAGQPGWVSAAATAVRTRCQPPAARARVIAAKFGEDAGMVGAAVWAREYR
jgi:glucokinase